VTNTYFTNGYLTTLETNIGPCAFAPAGIRCTNRVANNRVHEFHQWDYYLLPTNSDCGVFSPDTLLNYVSGLTNDRPSPPPRGRYNANAPFFSQTGITYSTNHAFVINPVRA